MNELSETFLQAVDLLIQNRISKLDYDRTIEAEIYSITNLDEGEYIVKFSGNTFPAFAANLSEQYDVGDVVFVVVPEGNFSNRKVITALATTKSISYTQMTSLQNQVVEISPTFDREGLGYDYDRNPDEMIGVVAGAPEDSDLGHAVIFKGPDEYSSEDFHSAFQQYTSQYEYICIQASFLTQFHDKHTKGNYGLKVVFYANGDGKASYQFDINSFNGDPYGYVVYSPQSVVIKAPKNYLLGLKSIELFQKDFEYDCLVIDGLVQPEQKNEDIPNIFVKNISLAFVEVRDLTDISYYLTISTPKGNVFTPTTSSIDLVGRLVYQGKELMSAKNCECKWFKRDLSITIGEDLYDKQAGFGWRPIQEDDREKIDFNTLTVEKSTVKHQALYKLIVIYNDKVIVSAEMEVLNLETKDLYNYRIEQVTTGEVIKLQLTDGFKGDWYISYPDGSYTAMETGKVTDHVEIQDYLLYSTVTFYCSVYDKYDLGTVGTIGYVVSTSESQSQVNIDYDGESQFRYDANGDVTIDDSELERTLQANITWKEGSGTRYKLEWIGPDGQLITKDRRTVLTSMMQNMWVDNNGILHYNIKQKYRIDCNSNTVTVKLTTLDNQVYTFPKEILFLKDGDQGTNGTTYVVSIRPCESNDWTKKKDGFQAIQYNNGWVGSMLVACYVYKDGELINELKDRNGIPIYHIEYMWSTLNVAADATNLDYRKIIRGTSSGIPSAPAYVKCQVRIKENNGGNGRTNIVYTTYPVDIAVGGIDTTKIDITNIPSYVKYTSSGINPSYYNKPLTFVYDDTDMTSTDNIIAMNTSILKLTARDNQMYLNPATSFIYQDSNDDNNLGLLKCKYTDSQYVLHTVIMYLDAYGNEAINGWDGSSIDLGIKDGQDLGRILAPQIGAGDKDSYNRFCGVIMGQDSGQNQIGLYGYDSGINTFGFMTNGEAYLGRAGAGRIIFNGNKGEIRSYNYQKNSSGMCIDLDDAVIDSPSFSFDGKNQRFTFKLADSSSSYFKITADTTADNNPSDTSATVFYINGTGNRSSYYLKSKDYNPTNHTGTKIDLSSGSITSYNFNITAYSGSNKVLSLSSSGDFYFDVSGGGSFVVDGNSSRLIDIASGGSSFYIRSDGGNQTSWNLSSGKFTTTNASIGGWTIGAKTISSNGVVLNSDGFISAGKTLYAAEVILNASGTKGGATGYMGYVTSDSGIAGIGMSATGALKLRSTGVFSIDAGSGQHISISNGSQASLDLNGGNITVSGQSQAKIGAGSSAITVTSNKIEFTSGSEQVGIYARFK